MSARRRNAAARAAASPRCRGFHQRPGKPGLGIIRRQHQGIVHIVQRGVGIARLQVAGATIQQQQHRRRTGLLPGLADLRLDLHRRCLGGRHFQRDEELVELGPARLRPPLRQRRPGREQQQNEP
jgi:hypothetical protein